MSGTESTSFASQAARRVLAAGAALLASAALATAHAHDSTDQTAMAIPRVETPGGTAPEVALPQPLTPSDAARVRRIFADQAHGRMADAERETAQLGDPLLLGPILADRYLGRFHRATVAELTNWLTRYSALPNAPAIHTLLAHRLSQGVAPPSLQPVPCLAPAKPADPGPADTETQAAFRNPPLEREVAARVQAGEYTPALHLIAHTKGLDPSDAALLRADVARGLFTANRDQEAMTVAAAAWRTSLKAQRDAQRDAQRNAQGDAKGDAKSDARPAMIAGLAAWRLGHIRKARSFFTEAATASVSSSVTRAAAAFWAARAERQLGDADAADSWLKRAAVEKSTFYGLIARQQLGWGVGLIPENDTISEADLDALAATPQGLRAFALFQVDQPARAEQELRCLWPQVKDDRGLRRSLLLVGAQSGLMDFATQIGALIQTAEGIPHEDLRFPLPQLHPAGGFRFDPALVYGITRAESNFDAKAVSPSGARGLMQIMPITARAVTGKDQLPAGRLRDPAFNLDLGQRWVQSLARDQTVGGDLIDLLCSYNTGVGSFSSWGKQIRAGDDPLLFIEAIPITETRNFVERALTYTWMCAAKLGLPTPSLDALADDEFPRFRPAASGRTLLVSVH